MAKPILVIGIGDTARGDRGLGVHLLRLLELNSHHLEEAVELRQVEAIGPDLLACMRGRRRIIFLLALDTGDPPGIVYRLPVAEVPPGLHDASVADLVRKLWILGEEPQAEMIAISAPDTMDARQGLSAEVLGAVPAAIEVLLASITEQAVPGVEVGV